MNWRSLLQKMLLVASVKRIICQLLPPFRTLEEQEEGTKIGTISRTFSPPYRLLGGTYLRVNEETGEVYTTGQRIDRESLCPSMPKGDCVILADVLFGPEQEMMKITVIIEDINDNAPYFETNEIRLNIFEDVAVGTKIQLDELAWDRDAGSNAEIQYHLQGAGGVFSLAQGEITVERELDRETQDKHLMNLVAVDNGAVPLSATALVIVTILDVDDNCPQFTPGNLHNVTVAGGTSRGAIVAQVSAIDQDLGKNSQITYGFSPLISVRAKRFFHLDHKSGTISLTTDLKLENLEEHVLKVVANSPPCPVAQTQVTVYLLPVKNPRPDVEIKYLAEYKNQSIVLRENEPPTVLAFLKLRESVEAVLSSEDESGVFVLKPQAGSYLLSTSKPLDFELCRSYQFSVVIAQGDHVLGMEVIKVAVEDVNDNAPQFETSHYHVEIEENNDPMTSLLQVKATDSDSQNNGKVTYSLLHEARSVFSIDAVTGILSVLKTLDREEKDGYALTVLASDLGSPPLKAFANISLKVLDQNDNVPNIITSNFFILESVQTLAHVGKIAVSDVDEGDNGQVVDLQVLDKDVPFAIDMLQMTLRCTGDVDREIRDHYELILRAVDGGRPQRSSTATLTVFIEDVNDNQPQVILPSSNLSCLTVSPSTMVGSSITQIHAIDRDSGINSLITYHIIPREPDEASPFRIDPHSGNITLTQRLLNTDRGLHHLLIKVRDGGEPSPLQASVWVSVLVNETTEPCHLTSFPRYLPPMTPKHLPLQPANSSDTGCLERSWIILLCGLSMIAFSVCILLASAVICLRQKALMRKIASVRQYELKPLSKKDSSPNQMVPQTC